MLVNKRFHNDALTSHGGKKSKPYQKKLPDGKDDISSESLGCPINHLTITTLELFAV